MIAPAKPCTSSKEDALQAIFLALKPKIETHARIQFRFVHCADQREDKVAEALALAWVWFVRLTLRGKDVCSFPQAFASRVAKAVQCGRRLCGQERARDAMSSLAQQRHGFRTFTFSATAERAQERLAQPHLGQRNPDVYEERLQDNTITPIPDQAAFRIDFPAWLSTMTERERALIQAMAADERTLALSQRFQVSPGRISQLRQEFKRRWQRFCGEQAQEAPTKARERAPCRQENA